VALTDLAEQTLGMVQLPTPRTTGGMHLFDALKARHSTREYESYPLPVGVLSDLLWCAWGVNRHTGEHTAPSWRHSSELDVYVFTAQGIWLYDAKWHRLQPILAGDHRAKTGKQDYPGIAGLDLVYVGDLSRMAEGPEDERRLAAFTDAGFVGQNVYLFCASAGLGSVFRGLLDRDALARLLCLGKQQVVTYAQTVGYPKSK